CRKASAGAKRPVVLLKSRFLKDSAANPFCSVPKAAHGYAPASSLTSAKVLRNWEVLEARAVTPFGYMYWKLHSRRQCRFRKRRADKAPPPPKRRCGLCPPCSETKRRLARVLRSPPKARHKAGAGFQAPYRYSIAPYCAGTPPRRRRIGSARSNPLPAWVCANTESPPARGRAWKSLRFCCANPQPCARRSQKVSATL